MNTHIRNLLDENGPELTREEEQEVFREYKDNPTKEIRNMIALKYRKIAISIAHKYHGYGGDIDDWLQEGFIGLTYAVQEYNPDSNACFYTYAYKYIQHYIRRATAPIQSYIRLPEYLLNEISRIEKTGFDYIRDNGCQPEMAYIMTATGLSEKEIKFAWEANIGVEDISADKPIKDFFNNEDDNEESTIIDMTADSKAEIPFEEVEFNVDTDDLVNLIKPLVSDREYFVLACRFGFEGCEIHSLESIGDMLKVTREQARAIEKSALRKILKGKA